MPSILTGYADNPLVMVSLSVLSVLFARPLLFPPQPIATQVQRGVQLYTAGKRLEFALEEDRKFVGSWFDGKRKRNVEEVIWISPELVSRWLGYLDAKEKWPAHEREMRWFELRNRLNQKLCFAVRLAAYPKIDFLEGEESEPAKLDALGPLRFSITLDGKTIPIRPQGDGPIQRFSGAPVDWPRETLDAFLHVIDERQSREAGPLEDFPWYQFAPVSHWLTPEFDVLPPRHAPRLGGYHSVWLWVEAPLPEPERIRSQFELRIFGPRRERIATFEVGPRPKHGRNRS
jgi:hypothetical protein